MGGMSVCGIDTRAGLSFLKELDANDFVSRLDFYLITHYIICALLHGS